MEGFVDGRPNDTFVRIFPGATSNMVRTWNKSRHLQFREKILILSHSRGFFRKVTRIKLRGKYLKSLKNYQKMRNQTFLPILGGPFMKE